MFRILFAVIFPTLLTAQEHKYVVHYEHFTIANGLSHNHVYQSYKDSRGILWLITENGLNRFDGTTFKFIPQVDITDTPSAKIFLEDNDSDLWIGGAGQEVYCFNIYSERVRTAREKFGPHFPAQVLSAIKGVSDTYYLQTARDSIQRFTPGGSLLTIYNAPGREITPVAESSKGTVWLKSAINDKRGEILAIHSSSNRTPVFQYPSGRIYCSGMWAADKVYYTTADSFFVLNEKGIIIRTHIRSMFPENHVISPSATALLQQVAIDPKTGNIWCSTPDGVHIINSDMQLLYDFRQEYKRMLPDVYHIQIDKQQYAWMSTMNGLYQIRCNPNPFQVEAAGTTNWLQRRNGLYREEMDEQYPPGSKDQHPPSGKDVRHTLQDTDGSWWMATAKGLVHVDWLIGLYRQYTVNDGLSHNSCYALVPDHFGFLWISNSYGIMQFEKRSGRIKTYYKSEGLGIDKFYPGSGSSGPDGTIYFGGINGVISFHPGDFSHRFDDLPDVNLIITECRVFSGETKREEDERAHFFKEGKIIIRPRDRYIQMNCALTDYSYPERIDYEYKIEGYGSEWKKMDKNVLRLADLPHGTFMLHVKARAADGRYAGHELVIPLRVLRPVYLQPGFLILLVVNLLGSFMGYKKYKNNFTKVLPWKNTIPSDEPGIGGAIDEEYLPPPTILSSVNQEDALFLERLQVIILEHLDDLEFDARVLGKAAGLSNTQLHRRLTALTGLSAGRYIYSIRLKEAKKRIEQTNLTIAEIAYQTGFNDPAYFTRLFSRMFKVPPKHFRESK